MFYIIAVLIIIVFALYIRFSYKVPQKIMILQTSVADFKPNILLEKQPIVVQDRLDNVKPILDDWFRFNKKAEFTITPDMEWIKNKHKYMAIHSLEDCEILLCSPLCKVNQGIPDGSEQVIAIKLYKGMILIVPYRWYLTTNKPVYAHTYHDMFTYLLPA